METWKYLRAILLLPFMVTVVIPGVLLWLTGPDTLGVWQAVPATRVALLIFGSALICLGIVWMVATIRLFVTVGKGTLAPWNPPQRFVVRGVYRHVRNPMIAGVFFVLLGETVLAAFLPLLGWFSLAVIVNAVLPPADRGTGAGEAVRRRLPGVQAERAEMDSQAERMADSAARS